MIKKNNNLDPARNLQLLDLGQLFNMQLEQHAEFSLFKISSSFHGKV